MRWHSQHCGCAFVYKGMPASELYLKCAGPVWRTMYIHSWVPMETINPVHKCADKCPAGVRQRSSKYSPTATQCWSQHTAIALQSAGAACIQTREARLGDRTQVVRTPLLKQEDPL